VASATLLSHLVIRTVARMPSPLVKPQPSEAFSATQRLPWRTPIGLAAVLEAWQSRPRVFGNVTLHERTTPVAARHAPLPEVLAPGIASALGARGIGGLYIHQRAAFEHALAGRDLVIATPTASGKSLCYNLPVLQALALDPSARALYLFPTKALARDQEAALRALMHDAGLARGAITYDGDTPGDARRAAREQSSVLLTNPDMLHAGILPHHTSWARFFANLRYVVIDELHIYRGVFGSHLANVLRRLDRIARFHGSAPVFIMSSATIGNPREHASRMLGREVELIDESGAPLGPRRVIVYNPPVVNLELGIRESYLKAAVRLTTDLVLGGVSTLVFGQSRNNVEVMLKYLRERLAREHIPPERVAAYRGGYLPELRRSIEQSLRDGELSCVVATSALELGIDIGALDAVVCAGYPGTLAGLWQRFGRGGRRGGESLAMLIASSAPLDQYVAREQGYLLGAAVEQARIDPDNAEILVQHVKCSAFELPFERGERFGDLPPELVQDALEFLSGHGLLHPVQSADKTMYHWASDAYPANHVSLRSVGWDNFVIIDVEREASMGEMDWRSTHTMLHEQAIYQHEGEQYQVERLDFENHKAFVRKVGSDYFTNAMTHVRVGVLEVAEEHEMQAANGELGAQAGRGDVSVVEKVVGYKKIKYHTHENVGYGEVSLPEMQMHTTAFWLTVPEAVVERQAVERPLVIDALRGIAHALHTVACVGLMADPSDMGHTLGDKSEPDGVPAKTVGGAPGFDPTVFLYDRVPGGIGLSPRLFEAREELVRRARAMIESCVCAEGCPACVGPVIGPSDLLPAAAPSRKRVALALLADIGVGSTH
jgi:DEAD/DEAH box helicase domain-containing protein